MIMYSVTEFYDFITAKKINSNCPNCGNPSLKINFFQKRIEAPFSSKRTSKVSGTLFCYHDKEKIPPVLWTDDIAHRYETEKEKVSLLPTYFKMNKWFYSLLIFIGIIAVISFMYFKLDTISQKKFTDSLQAPEAGLKVKASSIIKGPNQENIMDNTWFMVEKIKADTVFIKRHKDHSAEDNFDFNLNDNSFTGPIYKVKLEDFKNGNLFEHSNTFNYLGAIMDSETH